MGEKIDRAKYASIGQISRRSGDRIREGRRPDGVRVKQTTDELGNTVTEHATTDDRVDVAVRPQTIRYEPKGGVNVGSGPGS